MSLEPTPENIIRVWGECVALSVACSQLAVEESFLSLTRRQDIARAAVRGGDLETLLGLLIEQLTYMGDVLIKQGFDPNYEMERVTRPRSGW